MSDDLFSQAGIVMEPVPPTPEELAGKMANQVFRPWYKKYYEGRYTQTTGHINKVLKQFVLDVVVNGEESLETVVQVMDDIGAGQKPVTPMVLQISLGQAKKELRGSFDAGLYSTMAHEREFTDFVMGQHDPQAYGSSVNNDDDEPGMF